MSKKITTLRIDDLDYRKLRKHAARQDISASQIIRKLIRDYIKKANDR